MKFLGKLNPNEESKLYVTGTIFTIVALFILTGVVFLLLIANKLDIVMSQPADETYTYFISIMDKILGILTLLVILPLSIYQFLSKNKQEIDKTISFVAIGIILIFVVGFFGGQHYYFKKYAEGELQYSKLFCKSSFETKMFDKVIEKQGKFPPQMCQPRPKKHKR